MLPTSWQFLGDFLTMPEEALDLPCIKVGGRAAMDLHLIRCDKGVFIVVLDASAQEFSQGLIQQKSNELSLLHGRQQKLLEQYVGSGIADTLMQQIWDPTSQGERRILTILFADIRGFTPYSEVAPPGEVFQTLNSYLRAMINPITDQGGFVDKLIGDQVMALFGLLPEDEEPAASAVRAALQIVAGVRELHGQGTVEVELGVGVGITTGPVALGILGTKQRRAFSAIGHHVNVAARLESHARRGEILIDAASYAQLGADKTRFSKKLLQLKGLTTPMTAYACELTE
jgi:class 3 adenylate cyclase